MESAVAFLASQSPLAAERFGLGLIDTIFKLARFPLLGAPVHARPGYRRIVHHPWHVIFYRVAEAEQRVEIVHIWDGRQNPNKLILGSP